MGLIISFFSEPKIDPFTSGITNYKKSSSLNVYNGKPKTLNVYNGKPKANEPSGEFTVTSDTVFVLWVRHCNSCANEAFTGNYFMRRGALSVSNKTLRQALCTKLGIVQSIDNGRKFAESDALALFKGVRFYCSPLPRAVQTAILFSQYARPDTAAIKVQRLPYVIEHAHGYNKTVGKRGSQSSITYKKSNDYAKALTCIFGNMREGARVTVADDVKDVEYDPDKVFISGEDDYSKFLSDVLPTFRKKGVLNVVVGHGDYIRKNVLAGIIDILGDKGMYHPDNLDAFLIAYNREYPKGIILKATKKRPTSKKPTFTIVTRDSISTACLMMTKVNNAKRDENAERKGCLKGITTIKTTTSKDKADNDIAGLVRSGLIKSEYKKFINCKYSMDDYDKVTC